MGAARLRFLPLVLALAAALAAVLILVWSLSRPARAGGEDLARARQRGYLIAGVPLWMPPFGAPARGGGWAGLDVALARGVAAAALGNPDRVHLLPLAAGQRRWAVLSGAADFVAAAFAAPGTAPPDLPPGIAAIGPYATEPVALLVRRGGAVAAWTDLDGATVGVLPGSAGAAALRAAAGRAGATPVLEEAGSAAVAARDLASGRLRALIGGAAMCAALAAYDPELQVEPVPSLGTQSYWVLAPPGASALGAAVRRSIAALPSGPALAAALAAWARAAGNPTPPAPAPLLTPPAAAA